MKMQRNNKKRLMHNALKWGLNNTLFLVLLNESNIIKMEAKEKSIKNEKENKQNKKFLKIQQLSSSITCLKLSYFVSFHSKFVYYSKQMKQ